MVPSKKQQKIFDTWVNTDQNILIQAVAGSGKTTTLLELLKLCRYKTLFLAFNKTIQTEIQERIDKEGLKQGKALTLHSLGLSAIRAKVPKVKVNNSKAYLLVSKTLKLYKKQLRKFDEKESQRIFFTLMDLNEMSRLYLNNDLEELLDILTDMDKSPYNPTIMQTLWTTLLNMREESYTETNVEIDFTDMVYLPVKFNLKIPIEPHYLMVDEAQDLNLCQHKLLQNLIGQGHIKKTIIVGDRNQAIYGFSGAHASSFDMFKKMPNIIELPLDICYRCPKGVIEMANKVYDVLIPFKQEKGLVKTLTENSESSIKEIGNYPNAMVICRNKGPLIGLYFELIKHGMPCYLLGDDILTSITRFLKPLKSLSVRGATHSIELEIEALINSNINKDEKAKKLFYIRENFENFKKIAENMSIGQAQKIEELLKSVENLFKAVDNAVTLCTIHKSKGLEAETVFILNEFLIPSVFAKSKQQIIQETNLKYVARTRAMKNQFFINHNFT